MKPETKEITQHHCLRCDNKWWPRTANEVDTPKRCARCQSPNWQTLKPTPKWAERES